MRFERPEFLILLLLIPISIALFFIYLKWRARSIKKLGDAATLNPLMNGYIPKRQATKFIFMQVGLLFAIIGLANPQQTDATVSIKREGIDIIFALDVSNSMLANDVAPSRLERAKQAIKKSLDKMRDNRVGLVVFAGNAYLQVPLTVDYNAMKMFLDNVSPNMVGQQGTVLSDAIELSEASFSRKENKYKSIILISDGEDHDKAAVDLAKSIVEKGTIINTIGVGSPQGSLLINPTTGEPRTDEKGEKVISKLNEQVLKDIAQATKGSYFLLNNINTGADNIIAITNKMEKTNLGDEELKAYKSYFQYFLAIAIICIIISLLLPTAYKNSVL